MRATLRVGRIRLLLASYSLGAMALGMVAVVTSIQLFARTDEPAWASVGSLVQVLPFVLLSPMAGVLGDRVDPRRLVCAGIGGELTATMLVLTMAEHGPVVLLAVGGLFAHASWTLCYPNTLAALPRTVDADQLAPAMSLITTVDSAAWFVGPGIGGVLLTVTGVAPTLVVAAAMMVVALVLAFLLARGRLADALEAVDDEPFLRALVTGLSIVVRTRALVGPLLVLVAIEATFGAGQVVLLVAAADLLQMSDGGFGALSAAIGSGACGALVVGNRLASWPRPLVALVGTVLFAGVPLAVAGLSGATAVAVPLLVIAGLGIVCTELLLLTTLQRNAPADVMARVFGVLDSLSIASVMVGSLAAAPLLAAVGPRHALVLLGLAVPVALVLAMPLAMRGSDEGLARVAELRAEIGALAHQRALRRASRASIERLAAAAVHRRFAAGDVVVRQGDPADAFYAIVSGDASVHIDGRFVRELGSGRGFGELGLLHAVARTATVTATSELEVLEVPGTEFVTAVGPGRSRGGVGLGSSIRDLWTAG
jgi:predicted MFS family arabinose efflux permease